MNGTSKKIDTSNYQANRKRVRALKNQEKYESRKLWFQVTQALKKSEFITASRVKKYIS
jgi:hypothetical protein